MAYESPIVLYLCDGKKPECCGSNNCYLEHQDGLCQHTSDPHYAKNGLAIIMLDPREHEECFEKVDDRYYERPKEGVTS